MKQLITLCLSAIFVVTACNNPSDTTDNKTTANQTPTSATVSDNQDKATEEATGATLISGADCSACHQENTKLVGPSWVDIAQKYTAADVDRLATTVIDGGTGNWGDMQMTPHPTLSKDQAVLMVEYILTKKTK